MAQSLAALRGRIHRQRIQIIRQRAPDQRRRSVLRFTNGQPDLTKSLESAIGRRWRYAAAQLAQLFKRIGLQAGEIGIHE